MIQVDTYNIVKSVFEQENMEYQADAKGRLQIRMDDLRKLDRLVQEQLIDIEIPDEASVILRLFTNPAFFLSKRFPGVDIRHKVNGKIDVRARTEGSDIISWRRRVEVYNGYFKDECITEFKESFGLNLKSYEYRFYVSPETAMKFTGKDSKYELPAYNKELGAFVFTTIFKESCSNFVSQRYKEEIRDFDMKYTRLKKFFTTVLGQDNYRFESVFQYEYNSIKYDEYLNEQDYSAEELFDYALGCLYEDNVSFNTATKSIGIDFNWRTDHLHDAIARVINKATFADFRFYKIHKCIVDVKTNHFLSCAV